MTDSVAERTNISDQMRAATGRELSRRVSYPVTDSDIRRWAIAVHHPQQPPRLYWDAGYATSTEHGGIVAPLDFNPFAWLTKEPGFAGSEIEDNDPDKIEKTIGIPGPGLKFQLNGGLAVTYGVRMRPGDVITGVTLLGGYRERAGRLGLMLISTTEETWTNQRSETVKQSTLTLIRY